MSKGRFGQFGGQYITETLMNELINLEKQYETDEELSSIKSDSDMQTAVPKLKKKYHPQKGMPVKIVIEPDDDLGN